MKNLKTIMAAITLMINYNPNHLNSSNLSFYKKIQYFKLGLMEFYLVPGVTVKRLKIYLKLGPERA
jgi:hypothetical protein